MKAAQKHSDLSSSKSNYTIVTKKTLSFLKVREARISKGIISVRAALSPAGYKSCPPAIFSVTVTQDHLHSHSSIQHSDSVG